MTALCMPSMPLIGVDLVSSDSRSITELKPKGSSIGLFEDEQFSNILEEQKLYLNDGDFLLFYSDGITEATDPKNHMFDIDGLKLIISESANESSETIVNRIDTRLREFVRSAVTASYGRF